MPPPEGRFWDFFNVLRVPLRNRPFNRYLLYAFSEAFACNLMGPFWWLFALEGLKTGDIWATVYVSALPMVVMVVAYPFWGRRAKRLSDHQLVRIGIVSAIICTCLWMLTTSHCFHPFLLLGRLHRRDLPSRHGYRGHEHDVLPHPAGESFVLYGLRDVGQPGRSLLCRLTGHARRRQPRTLLLAPGAEERLATCISWPCSRSSSCSPTCSSSSQACPRRRRCKRRSRSARTDRGRTRTGDCLHASRSSRRPYWCGSITFVWATPPPPPPRFTFQAGPAPDLRGKSGSARAGRAEEV